MHYYMYQITNKVNGKIYVGVHKTEDLNDGYMGSGKIIRSAIAKHGISNFSKVILEHFENQDAMYAKEAEIVNEEFLAREDTYNLRRGGFGGFDHINKNEIFRERALANRTSSSFHNMKEGGSRGGVKTSDLGLGFKSNTIKNKAVETRLMNGDYNKCHRGKIRSDDARKALSVGHIGEKNSQHGTMWITNDIESLKIKKTDSIPEGYRKGRIIKNNRALSTKNYLTFILK